jgi:hypothetical protein
MSDVRLLFLLLRNSHQLRLTDASGHKEPSAAAPARARALAGSTRNELPLPIEIDPPQTVGKSPTISEQNNG